MANMIFGVAHWYIERVHLLSGDAIVAKNIDPMLKLISEYLKLGKNTSFVIPEYQRAYSWTVTPDCDKLWQDIEAFIESDCSDPYFFGTIIVDCQKNDTELCLIDGQQRTTTFLLLLKALLIRLNEAIDGMENDEESLSLKDGLAASRDKIMEILYYADATQIRAMLKNFATVKTFITMENRSNNEHYKEEVKKIIEAENFEAARQKVVQFRYKKKEEKKYTNHFRNFKYFYDRLREKSDSKLNRFARAFLRECQIIEIRSWDFEQAITMFNSLNSTGVPLSGADIISAQLYSNAGDDKAFFNEEWKALIDLADKLDKDGVVKNIDAILTHFMYINRARNKEYVTSGKPDVTVPGLRRYYTDIAKGLLREPRALCAELMKIAQTWEVIKDFPIVKLLTKFNENVKLYLAGYLSRFDVAEITEECVLEICECLLRLFTILELVDAGYSSANFKTFLFGVNLKLVDKDIPVHDIIQEFNTHILSNWKKEVIVEAISEHDKHNLVFLNEYIYMKNNGVGDRFDFAENVNVEHIMPRSGRDKVSIRIEAGITDEEEFDSIVNKLGNKILLEENINKSIGNATWFKTKKQTSITAKSGYKDSKYAIARALTEYPQDTWGKNDIEAATKKAAERIVAFIFQG